MTLAEAQQWMGARYVLHPAYLVASHPHHSAYALVDLRATFARVRLRMAQPASFADAVSQVKARLRIVHGAGR